LRFLTALSAAGNTDGIDHYEQFGSRSPNGTFTVTLDFGSSPFTAGADRWLEVSVRKATRSAGIHATHAASTNNELAVFIKNLVGNFGRWIINGPASAA